MAYIDYDTDSTWNVLKIEEIKPDTHRAERVITEIESRYFNSDTLTFQGFITPIDINAITPSNGDIRINVFKTKTVPQSWPGAVKGKRIRNVPLYMKQNSRSFIYLKNTTKGPYYRITGQWINGLFMVYGNENGVNNEMICPVEKQ